MGILNPQTEKPKLKTMRLVVDFPDHQTMEIFNLRWQNTAYMLGVRFKAQPVFYGEEKIRYEFAFDGKEESVEEFQEFIDKSLALAVDISKWPEVL
jgi:hypothetical protein